MKKFAVLLLAAIMVTSVAACTTTEEEKTTAQNQDAPGQEQALPLVTEGKLIMSTNAGFAPYEYLEGDSIVGVDVDIAQYIADELNLELEIMDVDFTNALLAPQQNKSDFAAAGVSITEERKKSMDFSVTFVLKI